MYEKQMQMAALGQQSIAATQAQYAAMNAAPAVEDTVSSLGSLMSESVSHLFDVIEALERDLTPVYLPCPVPSQQTGDTIAPPAITQMRTLNAGIREASERIHRIRNGLRV